MKFLHTADWQIGMKAAHAGLASPRVREARVESARQIIDIAQNENVEFLLLAGDTFEDNGVDRSVVQKVGDILAAFGRAVYVLPGNHDPLAVGSVWEHPVWASHANVHVMREARPVELPSGFLFPCPVFDRRSKSDPTGWIATEGSQAIRIGLAHGTVEGNPAIEPSLPIPRDAVSRARLDYLALGHWHSTTTYEDSKGEVRMAYSGTHEPTSFRERASGNVLLVEIPEPSSKPEIRTIPTGSLHWESMEVTLIDRGELIELRRKIEAMPASKATLIDIRLIGLLFADEATEIARLEEIVSSRFLCGCIASSSLMPAPADEDWVSRLPCGFLRSAGARLREMASSGADGDRCLAAARALRELYSMKREVRA